MFCTTVQLHIFIQFLVNTTNSAIFPLSFFTDFYIMKFDIYFVYAKK